jgi:hypothetical protein
MKPITNDKFVQWNNPRAAIVGMQKALNGALPPEDVVEWLGTTHDPSYWKVFISDRTWHHSSYKA